VTRDGEGRQSPHTGYYSGRDYVTNKVESFRRYICGIARRCSSDIIAN